MKKVLLLSLATVFMMSFAYAQETGTLPEEAQHFIDSNFSDETVTDFEKFDQILNTKESDILDFDDQEAYEVKLSNGIAIEFGKDGKMTEMESTEGNFIPLNALPNMIESYLETNYEGLKVESYEIDYDDQEVQLENGIDLEFDMDGRFVEED